MFYVYIIYSALPDKYYVGASANIGERLKKHNAKHAGFTSAASDWKVVYSQSFETKQQALQRETLIKGWKSRKMIEQLIKQSPAG